MRAIKCRAKKTTKRFERSERRAGKPINAIACAEIARAIKSVKLAKNKKGK